MRLSSVLLLAAALVPGTLAAQEHHEGHAAAPRAGLTFEFQQTNFDDVEDVSFLSGAYHLYGWHRLGEGKLFARLPFAYLKADSELLGDESSSSIGNPQIGYALERGNVSIVGSVFIPAASDEEAAPIYAAFADITRLEAFIPDLTALRLGVEAELPISPSTHVLLEAVPALWLYGGDTEQDNDFVLHHALGLGYAAPMVRASGRIEGSTLLTSEDEDEGDNTELQFGLNADFLAGNIRPGVSLRLPVTSELRGELGPSVGVSLTFILP